MACIALLFQADLLGRNGASHLPLTDTKEAVTLFINNAQDAGVLYRKEPPLLTGADFLDTITPGPLLGKIVDAAYELQISRAPITKETLKQIILKRFSSKKI